MKTRAKKKAAKRADPDKPELLFRTATVETRAGEEGEAPVVTMSVSSEEPVLTYTRFNEVYQYVYEILDHKDNSIDMARAKDGLVILDRHYGDQVGLMSVEIRDGKMGGPVEFCSGQRAQEIGKDAAKKLRKNVSVGYQVQEYADGSEGIRDGYPVVRATRWTPYEASFEPVPADTTVGVGRAEGSNKPAERTAQKGTKEMNPQEMKALFARAAKYGVSLDDVDMTDATAARAALDALIVDKQADDLAAERKTVIELKERKPEAKPAARADVTDVKPLGGDVVTEKKIARTYSVMNVMRNAAGITSIRGKKIDLGFEKEIDQECRAAGMGSQGGGQFIIPHAVLASRDLSVSGTSSATVADDLYSQEFIDVLRNYMVLGAAGVRYLTGLVGNVEIPKMSAGATGYWVAEAGDITESQQTLGQVTGTPHTAGFMTDITRRMLLQSTPAAEMLVREDMVKGMANTIQVAVFQGTGANGQPSAITNATGINNPSVTQGTPTYAEILGFPGAILADAAAADNQKWIGTAEVWEKLAATDKASGAAQFVLNVDTNKMIGRDYLVTEDVGANSLFFGDWSTVMIGVWGNGIDLNMDTATLSASGGLRMVALQDVDVMVRQGKALAYNALVTS